MALRLVDITLPADRHDEAASVLEEVGLARPATQRLNEGQVTFRVVLEADRTQAVVDALERRFGRCAGFELLILPVEAALPRVEPDAGMRGEEGGAAEGSGPATPSAGPAGLSREELYHDIVDMTKRTDVFIATVLLSAVVAAVGMLRDNAAVIIGAMVIAPLLGPNVTLAFATTLGDAALMRRSLMTNGVGVVLSLALAMGTAIVWTIDPAVSELASRTTVQLSDIVLALAAGSAGALAITTGVPTALVGVMVAVALLPPTVALGLMLGAGEWRLAGGAAMLLATNVICVNLAGVATFLWRGVRPLTWWQADAARRAARRAMALWIVLLAALAVLIILAGPEEVVEAVADPPAETAAP